MNKDYQTTSVDIVSTTGRSVRTLMKLDNPSPAFNYEMVFDGKDDNYNTLPLGLYFVRFIGFSANGKKIISMKAFVIAGGMR
jgi:hypothetical protein